MEYMQYGTSPQLFCKWAAIAAIAGALERKVWVVTFGEPLYPGMYTILISPPGVGKTFLTSQVWRLWQGLQGHYTAQSSLTSASLVDELRQAERHIIRPGEPVVQFNSLKICANEMQVLIPAYDFDFMGKLTELWDCHPYGERRRKEDNNFQLKAPQVNLLAAATPKYMTSVIPEAAWDQGFLARCILIYSGEQKKRSLFAARTRNPELLHNLQNDLGEIASLYGEMHFTDEAQHEMDQWYLNGGAPVPDHPKLTHYVTRRPSHLLKLCQVSSAERGDDLTITVQDFTRALEWLLEAELYAPDIFKAMTSSADGRTLEDCHYAMVQVYVKTGQKPIPRARINQFLATRMPAFAVKGAIETMESAGWISAVTVEGKGTCYIPHQKPEAL